MDRTLVQLEAAITGPGEIPEPLRTAVARNLPLLRIDPAMTLPALARTLAGQDELVRTIETWSREWKALGRGAWLRALRPPRYPLSAPLLAEYRGVESGFFASTPDIVRFSRDVMKSTFGTLTVRDASTGESIALRPGPEDQLQHVVKCGDADIVAAGWFDDYAGVVTRFNVGSRKMSWRLELSSQVDSLALAAGGVVVATTGAQHHFIDLSNGTLVSTTTTEPGTVDVSPDGSVLAVRTGDIVRLWQLQPGGSSCPPPAGSGGFTPAQFSVGGKLLLSGSRLFDGTSGEQLATLRLEQPGYLEGGPAHGCTRVLDDGLIEAQVFHGLNRWNPTGALAWRDETRRHTLREVLAFSFDGSTYACRERRGAVIQVRETRSGTVLREIPTDAGHCSALAYSLDGARLAGRFHSDSRIRDVLCDPTTGQRLHEREGETQREVVGQRNVQWFQSLHGWSGFVSRRHELRGTFRGGLFEIVEGERVIASVPTDESLVASPDGMYWAGRHEHYQLER